jgi:hypothetical protein
MLCWRAFATRAPTDQLYRITLLANCVPFPPLHDKLFTKGEKPFALFLFFLALLRLCVNLFKNS